MEKSYLQKFKDWALSGTSEAEAMEGKIFQKVLKQLVKSRAEDKARVLGKTSKQQAERIKKFGKKKNFWVNKLLILRRA